MNLRVAVLGVGLCVGCGGAPEAASEGTEPLVGSEASALSNKDFDVTFTDCAEFAGIGFVPAENARPLVPAHYTLAQSGDDAIIVVRVARCANSVVDGKQEGAILTSQIGISVTGQDGTADINNYTLFYATDNARLHARLKAAGLDADNTKRISFSLSGGALDLDSASPHTPTFAVDGSAATPTADPTTFVASWWADGNHGVVRARTVFPNIRFSLSDTTLTTPAGSELAELIGGTTLGFPALDSYNTFTSAELQVRDTD